MNPEDPRHPQASLGQGPVRPGDSLNPYDLAPAPPAPPTPPASPPEAGPPASFSTTPNTGNKKFLDEFDDDTDFSDDANLPRSPQASPAIDGTTPTNAGERLAPFVVPGRGEAPIIAAVGGGVTVAAMIAAAIFASRAQQPWFPAAIGALFNILLHSATGVVAIGAGAHLAGRPLGSIALGAARMLFAVAAFGLLVSINIPIPGRFDESIFGLLGYAAVLLLTGRRDPRDWFPVFGSHLLLAAVVWCAFAVHAWVNTAPSLPKVLP